MKKSPMGTVAERGINDNGNRQQKYCPHEIEKFDAFENVHDNTFLIMSKLMIQVATARENPASAMEISTSGMRK